MMVLVVGAGVLAVICWLVAFVTGLMLLAHIAPEHTLGELFFKGYLFFQRDTFRESGHKLHSVMLGAMLGFFACILLGILIAVIVLR